ncbi:disease resistance protein [Senna tora]|uniref:Disease resistance protein n=1 Tax=Senna tora TaxID=362788 RepID=A0A834WWN5_9FABA|nr:disease resistance protein [Senna tora]
MNCGRIISLEVLNEEEAWALFQKHAQFSDDNSDSIKSVAEEITKECGGLPVAIAAVASTLKGKERFEWEEALKTLKDSNLLEIEEGLQSPYACLELSYNKLKNEAARSLFLLCSPPQGLFAKQQAFEESEITNSEISQGNKNVKGSVEESSTQENAKTVISPPKAFLRSLDETTPSLEILAAIETSHETELVDKRIASEPSLTEQPPLGKSEVTNNEMPQGSKVISYNPHLTMFIIL